MGYRGIPIEGVPFDDKAGKIPNLDGRVDAAPGQYVVGWAKRGPSGLIGTNRADSVETVKRMLEDAAAGKFTSASVSPEPEAVPALLRARGVRYVDFREWKSLDGLELAKGKLLGKIREKFTRVSDMLDALKGAKAAP